MKAGPSGSAPAPTVLIQVPNSKCLIPGCRDQNQTAAGREAQISHDVLVARKIQKQEACLYLPNLDLPIVETCGQDQARNIRRLGMVTCPEFPAGWRGPWAEGQPPHNLATVQRLLLQTAPSFWVILAASALGFESFRDELFL